MGGVENLTVIRGAGRFTDAHSLEVDGQSLRGERFFLNVGARPSIPPTRG